jgi:hypothetical protein
MTSTCTFITKSGKQCRLFSVEGSDNCQCIMHDFQSKNKAKKSLIIKGEEPVIISGSCADLTYEKKIWNYYT